MFNRKLRKRIRSLEDFFGLVYHQGDDKKDWEEHLAQTWGIARDLEKMLKERQDAKREKEIKNNK